MNPSFETIPEPESWLEIGTVVAPQGLKGQLRVLSTSDFPERFERPGRRWLQSPHSLHPQAVDLLEGRCLPGKNLYIIRLAGIEDREQAESLRGYKLLVPASDRPHLEADEYHVSDLIDLEVYHSLTGEKVGIVIDVLWAGNDLLKVKLYQKTSQPAGEPGTKTEAPATVLIPFVREIVPRVDLEKKRLDIDPPSGLLELAT